MECKITTQSVNICEGVHCQTVEQPIDAEFTMPDYCAPIGRILKCKLRPMIGTKSVNGSGVTIEGVTNISVYYTGADNERLNCYEYSVPFSKNIDAGVSGDGTVTVEAMPDYANCRASGERRFDVHATIKLKICTRDIRAAEIVTDIDEPSVQQLRTAMKSTSCVSTGEKYLIIGDEIELPDDKPPIGSLLRHDERIVIDECKMVSNKAVVKGNMLIDIVYLDDSGEIRVYNYSLPISQIVDLDSTNEDCDVSVNVVICSIDLKPRTDMNGEVRSLSVGGKICVCVSAFCNNDVPGLLDAYSTTNLLEFDKSDVSFDKLVMSINESFVCKKALDFAPGLVDRVLDCWCETRVMSASVDGDSVKINGGVNVCMMVIDESGAINYYERNVDFDYQSRLPKPVASGRVEPTVTAVTSDCKKDGSGVELKANLNIRADVIDTTHAQLITSAVLTDNKHTETFAPLVIYYAEDGEKVWDIAKRYNTSVDELSKLNGIDSDHETAKMMLLIPSV